MHRLISALYRNSIWLLTFVGTLALGLMFFGNLEEQRNTHTKVATNRTGTAFAGSLEQGINRAVSACYTLASVINQLELNRGSADFNHIARRIKQIHQGLDSVQLAPDGIVSSIYPLAGNEAAIGHNLITDPERRTDALRAINTRNLILSGPFELIQGGDAVVARYPVFNADGRDEQAFWGFTAVVIRLDSLLEQAGIRRLDTLGYRVQLSTVDGSGNNRIFFRSGLESSSAGESFAIQVPGGRWHLRLFPPHETGPVFTVATIATSSALALLLTLLARRFAAGREAWIVEQGTRGYLYVLPLLVFLSVLSVFWILELIERERLLSTRQNELLREVSSIRSNLEQALNSRLLLVRSLTAHVTIHPDIGQEEFQKLARQILRQTSGIRSLQLARNSVISHIYPRRGNENVLGVDLLELDKQNQDVFKAIKSRDTVFAGPVDLIQGGDAFISRTPVFLHTEHPDPNRHEYWGLATMILYREILFFEAGLKNLRTDIEIAIRWQSFSGTPGPVFYGNPDLYARDPVTQEIILPGGLWQIAAAPLDGWTPDSSSILWLRAAGILSASMLTILVWFLISYQARIHQNDQRFRLMVENLPAGAVFIHDDQLFMNRGMEQITGYRRQAIPTIGEWNRLLFKDNPPAFFTQPGFRASSTERPVELEILDRTGNTVYLDARGYRDANAEIWLFQDTTRSRTSEQERDNLKKQLLQAQKMETVGTLAGGIAHDFNNILAPITGYSALCLKIMDSAQPGRPYLEQILESATHARDLVRQILTFSRQQEPRKCSLELVDVVTDTIRLARSVIPATIRIETRFSAGHVLILANKTQIEQVVMNIITNAQHAMPRGGDLLIVLETVAIPREYTHHLKSTSANQAVRLAISDSGAGMAPYTLSRVFEPFFTTKRENKGSGLGLSVVHGIVSSHGGIIDIKSRVDEGTTVTIFFPIAPEQVMDDSKQPEPPAEGGNETIHVLDDDLNLLNMMAEVLSYYGYQVHTWSDPREALEAFREQPDAVDLIITDQTMPGLTGMDFSAAVLAIRPALPIIIMTGFSEILDRETALSMNIRDFLMKPVLPDQLNAAIRKILDA